MHCTRRTSVLPPGFTTIFLGVFFAFDAGFCLSTTPTGIGSIEMQPVVLQMMRNDSVFDELGLDDSQREQVVGVLDRADGPWWRSRVLQDTERIATVATLIKTVKSELKQILSEKSFARLQQLERQALGTRMFLTDDVAESLLLSPVTVQKIAGIAQDTIDKLAAIQKRAESGESVDALNAEQQSLAKAEQDAIVRLLTNGQKNRIGEVTGTPFSFAQIRRNLPRAPELIQAPENWLQGTPSSLAELRGKVVAVHFYAFQCINCQRNLPHYAAWYKDYADQGLVVIGIQTPETSTERDPVRVAAAAKEVGIEYPILMDPEGANWDTTGTRMWPTVYLIDRQGYLRAWWTGEMNWQGNPGEKKMRGHLETLLSEAP